MARPVVVKDQSSDERTATAIVLNAGDAARFIDRQPACKAVLAMSPAARAALKCCRSPVLSTSSFYSDISHRRTLVRQRKAARDFEATIAKQADLSPATIEILRSFTTNATALSARLWSTLRTTGPWLLVDGENWAFSSSLELVHATLLRRIVTEQMAATVSGRYGAPRLPWLASWMSQVVCLLCRSKRPILFIYKKRHLNELALQLEAMAPRLPVIQICFSSGRPEDYLRLLAALYRWLRGRSALNLLVVPSIRPRLRGLTSRLLNSLSDPLARAGIQAASDPMVANIASAVGYAEQLSKLLALVSPRGILTDSLAAGPAAGVGEAASRLGIPILLLSHSSHTPQSSAPAAQAMYNWARHGRVVSRFASRLLPKTPHAASVARCACAERGKTPQSAYVWIASGSPATRQPGHGYRVLHAGNFTQWIEHVPWVTETPDEYVDGLVRLVQVIGNLQNVKLVIRAKSKLECDPGALGTLLPDAGNVEIERRGSFSEDLAAADLLVSYSSSTIEEALHAHKPVLLWGGSQRYRHLPARSTPPTPDDRAAVYAPRRPEDLETMLTAILGAHCGRPLTDNELDGHIWPGGTPGIAALARQIVDGNL